MKNETAYNRIIASLILVLDAFLVSPCIKTPEWEAADAIKNELLTMMK